MANLGAVLVTGLFAGGLSCAAVQGGLLAGLVTRQRGDKPATGLADDLSPVGGFLAGKLLSHSLLGALLGALGAAASPSPAVTAWAQICAGLLIVVFGLAQLGAPGLRRLTFTPPQSWTRFVRGRARSQSALAPAILGFATVLVPCGVTLSVEALALTSGSVWAGTAIMAVFVIGTSPLFAALGYLARKAATVWRGRLAVVTGLAVLLLGVYTVNGGLVRVGSPLTAQAVGQAFGIGASPPSAETVTVAAGRQEVVLTATADAYSPRNLAVNAGVPTTLIVRSQGAEGCVRGFVIPSMDQVWGLPENGDTTIDLGVLEPGELRFSCTMGMYSGVLTIT